VRSAVLSLLLSDFYASQDIFFTFPLLILGYWFSTARFYRNLILTSFTALATGTVPARDIISTDTRHSIWMYGEASFPCSQAVKRVVKWVRITVAKPRQFSQPIVFNKKFCPFKYQINQFPLRCAHQHVGRSGWYFFCIVTEYLLFCWRIMYEILL
jgi:hypothetical protein